MRVGENMFGQESLFGLGQEDMFGLGQTVIPRGTGTAQGGHFGPPGFNLGPTDLFGLGQEATAPTPASPEAIAADALKSSSGLKTALDKVIAEADNKTPQEVLAQLNTLSDQAVAEDAKAESAALPGNNPARVQFRAVRFAASKSAGNIYKSLTPDGRLKHKALVSDVLRKTPHLRGLIRPEGIQYDEATLKFMLPNGKVAPGRRLGHEKKRLGWDFQKIKERAHARRVLKWKRRMEGKKFKKKEERELLDTTKPVDKEKIKEMRKGPKAAAPGHKMYRGQAVPTEAIEARKAAQDAEWKAKHKGFLGRYMQYDPYTDMGYLGQATNPADEHLDKEDEKFRAADVDEKIDLIDKGEDLKSALDAGMTPQDAVDEVEDKGISPVVLVGGLAVVGIAAYFLLKK